MIFNAVIGLCLIAMAILAIRIQRRTARIESMEKQLRRLKAERAAMAEKLG